MSYTINDVSNSYFGNGKIDKHKKDAIQIVKSLLIEKGSFHIDDVHLRLHESRGRPSTSKYGGILKPMVNQSYLYLDENGIYTPSNLLKVFLGIEW